MATELVEDKIRVNAILPGYIRTPTVDGMASLSNPENPESVVDGESTLPETMIMGV